MADQLEVPELTYTWAEAEAQRLAPRAHRAAADALYWANRRYAQPEFAQPEIIVMICNGSKELFRRLCQRSGLGSGK